MAPLMLDDLSISYSNSKDCDETTATATETTTSSSTALGPLHEEETSTSSTAEQQQQQQQQQPVSPPRKHVSFRTGVRVRYTRRLEDYTDGELGSSFYGPEEMRSMKEAVWADGRLLQTGRLPATTPSRGLEDRTREGAHRKRRSRANAYAAVWFEIDYQQDRRCRDPDAVAEAYGRHTADAATRARELGRSDERDARCPDSRREP